MIEKEKRRRDGEREKWRHDTMTEREMGRKGMIGEGKGRREWLLLKT